MSGLAGFAASEREAAAAALARDGVVRLDRVWDPAFITALRSGLGRSVPAAFDPNAQPPEELWRVGDRRINGLVPIAGPMAACAEMLANPGLIAIFETALGPDWAFESFGLICSYAGAEAQHVHSDAPHLFPENPLAQALPPFALTIAIALEPVDPAVNGSTEFNLGSHAGYAEGDAETFESCELAPGDCLIWDFRVRHRGQPNRSNRARPLLYATACRKFWTDNYNFGGNANRRLVVDRAVLRRLDSGVRKRFSRAHPVPGMQALFTLLNRSLRWHAPALHRAMRRLVRGRENPL